MRHPLLATVALTLLVATPAFPCGNSMHYFKKAPDLLHVASRHLAAGEYDQALASAKRVIHADGKVPSSRLRRARLIAGEASLRSRKFDEALAYLERAGGGSEDLAHQALLGEAEVATGRLDAGLGRLEALQARGLLSNARALVALARARLAHQDKPGAVKALDEALALQPDNDEAKELKARLQEPEVDPKPIDREVRS